MQNISSEQELKQLLDEGRITEEEYKELLETIRQKEMLKQTAVEDGHPKPQIDDLKKGATNGFIIAIIMVLMALLIKFVFGIGMVESMLIIGIAATPIILIALFVIRIRRKGLTHGTNQ